MSRSSCCGARCCDLTLRDRGGAIAAYSSAGDALVTLLAQTDPTAPRNEYRPQPCPILPFRLRECLHKQTHRAPATSQSHPTQCNPATCYRELVPEDRKAAVACVGSEKEVRHEDTKSASCPKFVVYDCDIKQNPVTNVHHHCLSARPASSTSYNLWPAGLPRAARSDHAP